MKAHAHTWSGIAVWLGGCVAASAAGHPQPAAVIIGGTVTAGGAAIWPDIDVQGTAARSLGWPSRVVARAVTALSHHRGATHWAVTSLLLGAAIRLLAPSVPGVAFATLILAVAFCEAGLAAENRRGHRIGTIRRWILSVAVAWVVLHYDPTAATWLGPAVAVGGLTHLAGDTLTTAKWPILAPFTWREFGGLGVIRPTPPRQRVTRRERAIESGLCATSVACALTLAGLWPLIAGIALEVATHAVHT